jgi:hypothetical protein
VALDPADQGLERPVRQEIQVRGDTAEAGGQVAAVDDVVPADHRDVVGDVDLVLDEGPDGADRQQVTGADHGVDLADPGQQLLGHLRARLPAVPVAAEQPLGTTLQAQRFHRRMEALES